MPTLLDIFDEITAAIDTSDRSKLDEQLLQLVRLQDAVARGAMHHGLPVRETTDREDGVDWPIWTCRCGCGAWAGGGWYEHRAARLRFAAAANAVPSTGTGMGTLQAVEPDLLAFLQFGGCAAAMSSIQILAFAT